MNSYIDLFIMYKGVKYPAKLYGDKIVAQMCNIELARAGIDRYKVHFFKRKIQLFFNLENIIVDYHEVIIRWFDPLYKLRLLITGTFMVFPVFAMFVLAGLKGGISRLLPLLVISLGVSAISGLLAFYFFRLARLNKEFLYFKIFLVLLVVSVPIMYWNPFSVYIVAAGAGIFAFFTIAHYIFSNGFNVYKYYLSLTWILLMIFLYFWIVSIFKIAVDYNLYNSVKGVLSESNDQTTYSFGSITWEKPIDWKVTRYSFFQTILKRRYLLWQFSPLPVQEKISTPESDEFGWIAVSMQSPLEVLSQINKYLEVQKNLLPAELLEKSNPRQDLSMNGQAILQSFTYYDMIERKVSSIHLLLIPVSDEQQNNPLSTMIFAFKISQSASVNYYLDLIKSGIKRRIR
ncbi:MAG: hypothetical protein OEV78_05515 [Spirochaetia bacterium]|nr:hypothetical protein [Spirochaetia bacterium]